MRAIFAGMVYALSLVGQGLQTLLLYYAVTDYYIDPKLALLLFFPTFIITYWLNLIFDAIITTKKSVLINTSTGKTIRVKTTVFPPFVKKLLRVISTLWTVAIVIVWAYFFVKFSMWYLF